MNFTLPLVMAKGNGTSPSKASDFLTSGVAGQSAYDWSFTTSTWSFQVRVALFNPTPLSLTLQKIQLDVVMGDGTAVGSATSTAHQTLAGEQVTWIAVDLDIQFGNMAVYGHAYSIATAMYSSTQSPVVNVKNIHLNLALNNFAFDVILNMYDVLGSAHLDGCTVSSAALPTSPQVAWKRVCNTTAAALVSTPVYNLQVKVIKATFTATGKCHEGPYFWPFSCPDRGDPDPYVEVALNAQFMDQPANTRTNVVRLSTHIPHENTNVDCELSACNKDNCGGASGAVACNNCNSVVGTCWGYPEWNFVTQFGPMTAAEAKLATVGLTVKDYDSVSFDDTMGTAAVTCPTVSPGAACTASVAFGTSGIVTYELSLWQDYS